MDNIVQVKLAATYDGFKASFTQAHEFMKGVVGGMKAELHDMSTQAKADSRSYEGTMEQLANVTQNRFKSINSAIEGVKTAWAQLAVVAAAAAFMKHAVDDSVKWNTESMKLSRALGITTNQASVLNLALGDIHATSDEYLAAMKGMDRQLKTNEERMNAMGLQTRDSSGHLRNQQEIMMDGLKLLQGYAEGTDRNLAAQALFGRGLDVSAEMLHLNSARMEDAAKKAADLNLVVGTESVAATEDYRNAMNDAQDVVDGLMVTIGNALMPVLTQLAQWFSDIGPSAILVIRIALTTVSALFQGLALTVNALWEIFSVAFKDMAEVAGTFGEVWDDIIHGRWADAEAASKKMFGALANNASESFDKIIAAAADTGDKIVGSLSSIVDGQGTSAGGAAGKGFTDPKAEEAAAKEAERLRKQELAQMKRDAAEARQIEIKSYQERMEVLKGDEDRAKGHWDRILDIEKEELEATKKIYGENSREYTAMLNKIAATKKARADEEAKVDALKAQAHRDALNAEIDYEEQQAKFQLDAGEINLQQMLQKEAEFENRRYSLKAESMRAQLALLDLEPIKQQEINNAIEKLEQDHALKMGAIMEASMADQRAPVHDMMESIKQGWSGTIASMLTGQMSLHKGMQALWKQMLASFTQYLATKLAASKAAAALEIAVEKMVATVLRVLHLTSAATSVSTTAAAADSKLVATAPVAGAKAAESQADIPYIGPILAMAAMAAMIAAIMGLRGGGGSKSLPSAASGFDIPAGMNPLTQLHEQEMVLPKEQADSIRAMTGTGGAINIHITAMDAHDVRRVLMDNKRALADSIKAAMRDGMR